MPTITQTNQPAVAVEYPRFQPTEAQSKALQQALKKIDRIDELMAEVAEIKSSRDQVIDQLLAGKLTIPQAGNLLLAFNDLNELKALQAAVRRPLKAKARIIVESMQPILDAQTEHKKAHVAKLANNAEKTERKQLREIGLPEHSFQPSRMLLSLRETHRRLVAEPPVATVSALRQILS